MKFAGFSPKTHCRALGRCGEKHMLEDSTSAKSEGNVL